MVFHGNHGSIRGSWPMAISGYPRGHNVSGVTRCDIPRGRSHCLILLSNRASPEPDCPPSERIHEDGKACFTGDAQAACRFNCLGSKLTPFFHMVKVMAAIFRARVRRAIVGRIPLATRAT